MKKVQMNLQVPTDVKAFIYDRAKADDRHPAYILEKLIRPMMIPAIDKNEGFDEFWEAYPKKKAKADALKSWTKGECWKGAGNIITDVFNRANHDPSWVDKQFVPNATTYLNGKRWEDEIFKKDNRPAFQKNNDALRDELFGNDGETYEHE
jgi:hypothetical protein